jgi:CRISPR/Cas system-associated exonuclease Cas4 (RecB family)
MNPVRKPGFKCACGNDKEMLYEELLVKSGAEYNFEGHVDAVLDVRGTKMESGTPMDVFVVDLKTMKDDLFFDLQQAKWEHVVQVHVYMWLLGLSAAVVLYENKDRQSVKDMFVPRDEALVERIKSEAAWMVDVLRNGKLPPRPEGVSKSKPPCRFCEFASFCYR